MKAAMILIIMQVCFFSINSIADDKNPPDAVNPIMNAKAEALIKSAMKVLKEDEGVISMSSPGHSFEAKTQILFFRKRGSRIEMIGTGLFNSEKVDAKTGKKELIADLDRDNIIKYPHEGDYAVPMNDPNLAAMDGKDGNDFPAPTEDTQEPKDDSRPGYFEYGMGLFYGNLSATPSGQVNVSKKTSGYRFQNAHFAYYSEYFPIGVEMDTHSGNFPTRTYESTVVTSSEKISNFSLNYRFKPLLNKHLAIMGRINSLSDTFTTNNSDDSLLNTKITGYGFGTRVQYDFVSPVWKKKPKEFFIQAQSIYGDFLYYPSISAVDEGISRGDSSSGSTMMQYRFGATGLAWISFIPIFKRWVFQWSYGARMCNLKFSGATVSEAGNPITVSPNSTSKDKESDYRFFIGVRLEDPIKLLFTDEKKEK
jgi:hypothetical protein